MERLKKVSTIVIAMLVLVLLGGAVNAAGLTLKTIAEKSEVIVGDEFKVTVDWTEGMQAVDFSLSYDKDKLEYVKSDLGAANTNNTGDKIVVSWFSDDDTDKTKVEFTFKAKAEGTASLSVNVEGTFATGELESPDSYDVTTAGTTTVTVKEKEVVQEPETPTPETDKPATDETKPETNKPTTDETKPDTNKPSTGETKPDTNKPTTSTTTNKTEAKPEKIPHAGTGENLAIGIVVLSAIIVFAYIQLKRYKGI